MKILRFEDLIAWQKAQDFAVKVYAVFSPHRDFGFRDQICRAVVSISNNISEGFERNSDLEFVRFLNIAKGSCSEAKSMIYLAEKLHYIDKAKQTELINDASEVAKIIHGLIKSVLRKKYESNSGTKEPEVEYESKFNTND